MPRIRDPRFAADCTIEVDGAPVAARAGESLAASLVAAGRFVIARSAKYHRARGPFCLAGSCHSCLARVDGAPNQRLCRIPARDGRVVTTQNALPTAAHDILAAIDHVYPSGLDHHHLMTWSAVANRAAVAVSRQLAGAGVLPSAAPPPAPPPSAESFDAAIVGAGPAGLGAAEVLAAAGRRILLVEEESAIGGRLRCAPPVAWVADVAERVRSAGGSVASGHTAIGIWTQGAAPLLLVRPERDPDAGLRLVRARSIVVATGTHALPPVLPCNDLPGIFAGRAVARLLAEDGIVPGRRCVVAGTFERRLVADALRRAGVEVAEIERLARAIGGSRVRGVVAEDGRRVPCEALVWCGRRSPAWDLVRAAGGALEHGADGWALRVDAGGATSVPGLRAAGEVVRPLAPGEAIEAGRSAGEAALGD